MLRRAGLLDEAHAAMDLDAQRGNLGADIGGERLGDRREECGALVGRLAGGGITGEMGAIERDRGRKADGARRPGERAHGQQHAPHVHMGDDRQQLGRRHAGTAALTTLARIGDRLLGRGFRDGDALQADREPGLVHHGEHGRHAAVFLADQIADAATVIAIDHVAGRRGVQPELVLDAVGAQVIAGAEPAVGVDQEFRDQEQRQAFGAVRRAGDAGKHEMDDVCGEVVLPIGDEDLAAGNAIAAVPGALGAGAKRADIGAGLRLGELHGAHPFARDELGQIGLFQILGAEGCERIDRRHGEHRADAERHCGRIPHLDAGGIDGARQALAAPFGRRGDAVPAGRRPIPIGFLPAGRRRHLAIVERRAVAVARSIERRQHFGRKPAGLAQHRLEVIVAEVPIKPVGACASEPRRMLEGEDDILDRRPVGHDRCSPAPRSP